MHEPINYAPILPEITLAVGALAMLMIGVFQRQGRRQKRNVRLARHPRDGRCRWFVVAAAADSARCCSRAPSSSTASLAS